MSNLFYKQSLLKKNISALLLIAMLFSSGTWILLQPKPAEALFGVGDIVFDPSAYAKMVANGLWQAAKWSVQQAIDLANKGYNYVMSGIAVWQKSESILKKAMATAAELLLRQVLNMLTNKIIAEIQGGDGDGNPRFVVDWEDFLDQAVDRAGGQFVTDYLGADWLCRDFNINIGMALQNVPTFEDRAKCTLTDIENNLEDFGDNFDIGGWKGWLEITQPQNNFYGAFMLAQEEKGKLEALARDAASKEAIAGGGFLSIKNCIQGKTIDDASETIETCSGKDNCKTLKENTPAHLVFKCTKQQATTPGAVISDVTSRAMDRGLDTISRQIASLAPETGLGPYITAIGDALINRVLTEGLSFVQSIGTTEDDPTAPMPAGTPITGVVSPGQAIQGQANAGLLIDQLDLIKENLETGLLPQQDSNQDSNMNVLLSIQTFASTTLKSLSTKHQTGCFLPPGATSQVIGGTVKISYSGTGYIIVNSSTYKTIEISTNVDSQINSLQDDINATNQRIVDTINAVAAVQGYKRVIDEYLELYDNTLQPFTEQEKTILEVKQAEVEAAKDIAISETKKATESTSNSIATLVNSATEANRNIVQETNNLITARGAIEGTDEIPPTANSLYADKKTAENTRDYVIDYPCGGIIPGFP